MNLTYKKHLQSEHQMCRQSAKHQPHTGFCYLALEVQFLLSEGCGAKQSDYKTQFGCCFLNENNNMLQIVNSLDK